MNRASRVSALVLVATIVAITEIAVLPLARVHAQSVETFRDAFGGISFGGNDGSQDFSGPWRERGEADGPAAGAIRVVSDGRCQGGAGQCLRIGTDNGTLDPYAVDRSADLGDAESATLRFSWRRKSQGQVSGSIAIRISANGGASWTTLTTLPLGGSQKQQSEMIDITAWMSTTTTIRFDGQGSVANGYIHFDNIEIAASIAPPVTTTTAPSPPTTTTTSPVSTTTTTAAGSTTTTTTTTTIVGSSTTTSVPGSTSSTTSTIVSATPSDGSSSPTQPPADQAPGSSLGSPSQPQTEGTTDDPTTSSSTGSAAPTGNNSVEASAAPIEDAQASSTDAWPWALVVAQILVLGLLIGSLALSGVGRTDS